MLTLPHTQVERSVCDWIEQAVAHQGAKLSHTGALVVNTGTFTGRAADDKYVVVDSTTEKTINWHNKVSRLTGAQYQALRQCVLAYLEACPTSFALTRELGAHPRFALRAHLLTSSASQALFFHNMLRAQSAATPLTEWQVLHAPTLVVPTPAALGLARPVAIALNFGAREIIVAGTAYAGEVKKALFSVLNTLLLDHGVLPMHAGANAGAQDVSVFFGLSGTGKTTLSADVGRQLIGDDEHGLADDGLFNFEGGCYAKTAKLAAKDEPLIFAAANRFGALLENVTLSAQRVPDFFDLARTENGRASYPLAFIPDLHPTQRAGVPQNIFFLSADAFGVLPAVAALDSEQAERFFLCGYTAKLAGTEVGVRTPTATFSYCFGAPFMLRAAREYGALFAQLVRRHHIKVWLVNTGWARGGFGKAERFPLTVTRQIIRSIQAGAVKLETAVKDPVFGFRVPTHIDGVAPEWLQACDPTDPQALALKQQFDDVLKKLIS